MGLDYTTIISWLADIVGSASVSTTNVSGIFLSVFGHVLVCMVVGFIFKFILKLFDR